MKKAYIVYLEDGKNFFKLNVPAENEKAARKFVEGNGDVITVKLNEDRNEENPISINYISDALVNAQFGQIEIDLILRALDDCSFIK